MIEIEIKVPLEKGQEDLLIKGAQFIKEIKIIDTYYDTEDYALTTKDKWLRDRNGSFELKLPLNEEENLDEREFDQYIELDNENEIRTSLGINKQFSLKDSLEKNNYEPFATITTKRRKYKKDGINIDVDEMDYGYFLAELELVVKKEEEAEKAKKRIRNLLEANNLEATTQIRGKLVEYIRRFRPEHYNALIKSGIISG